MFPTFERQPIDSEALKVAHSEAMKALRRAKAKGATGPEAALIAEEEKNKTYKALTGNDLPGFQKEASVLTNSEAIDLAEGYSEGTDEERIRAWQHLIDTGLAWQLQGFFGRTAMNLIESGICSPPKPMSLN